MDFHSVDQAELFLKIFGTLLCVSTSTMCFFTSVKTFPCLPIIMPLAGSAGDPNAAQLIVENRAVTLEYARESTERPQNNNYSQYQSSGGDSHYGQSQGHPYRGREREDRDGSGGNRGGTPSAGLDWICSSVSAFGYFIKSCFHPCLAGLKKFFLASVFSQPVQGPQLLPSRRVLPLQRQANTRLRYGTAG